MRATAESIILASIILAIVGPAMSVAIPSDPSLSKRGSRSMSTDPIAFSVQANYVLIVQEVPENCILFLHHGEENGMYPGILKARRHIEVAFDGLHITCDVFRSHQDDPSNAYTAPLFNMSVSPLLVNEL